LVLSAERLLEYFGPESFDVVIATELLERVLDWRLVVNNLKGVVGTVKLVLPPLLLPL
jgi:2-polyprenyl-3-methyl-5-hydroxy-6-metoxy-1,4-benzoquinol methylase